MTARTSQDRLGRVLTRTRQRSTEVFEVALRLGLTSFGGPVAHLGYFQREYVDNRHWLTDRSYADLLAVSSFLPGPASSQVGIGVGTLRAGYRGGLLAWLGFTLPSAILMVGFAAGAQSLVSSEHDWLHGLAVVAVAVVALAVWTMGRLLTPDPLRGSLAIGAAIVVLFWQSVGAQLVVLGVGALLGWRLLDGSTQPESSTDWLRASRRVGVACLAAFFLLLGLLPVLAAVTASHAVDLVDTFYRAGSLIFGGGHVVLPLLQTGVVDPGWVTNQEFVAGYGAAQAIPGPLMTFAAYLGYVEGPEPNGLPGAALALGAIFLPSFLLIFGVLPFWGTLRSKPGAQAALKGVNAVVVGLLLAALYDPVWVSAIETPADFALALAALGLLALWHVPPWAVVVGTGLAGAALVAWG